MKINQLNLRTKIISGFIAIELLGFLVLKMALQIIFQKNFDQFDFDFGILIYAYVIIVESVIFYSLIFLLIALAGFFIFRYKQKQEVKSAFKILSWFQFFILTAVIVFFFFIV